MEEKEYTQLSFPVCQQLHTKLKILAQAKGSTIRKLTFNLIKEYVESPESQKILSGLNS